MVRHPTPLRLLSLALLLFPLSARAGEPAWSKIQCTSPAALDARIRYCTDNVQATIAAQACAAQITKAWSDASKDLAILEKGPDAGQRLDFGASQERYDTAVERLRTLIDLTKRNTDLVAQYPTVMVDNPSMESWGETLPCFADVYGQVQLTVTQLDRKAAQGRRVLASASRLRASASRLAANTRSGDGAYVVRGGETAAAAVRRPASARQAPVSSDITGIRKEPGLN